MTTGSVSQSGLLAGGQGLPSSVVSKTGLLAGTQGLPTATVAQRGLYVAYGPPASQHANASTSAALIAATGGTTNVTAKLTQYGAYVAYATSTPATARTDAWTFVMDGHRFYVLPLGIEGDWAYDTTTHEWSELETQGFNGINFQHGVMWDLRVIGGDTLNPVLLELDPTQPFDDAFRPVQHMVTGGVPTRTRNSIGVANFTLTASVGDDATIVQPISLAFSDDNGVTYSAEFPISLTDVGSQLLIWNALGSFSAPGRVFRITDYGGPVRLDGADVVLTIGNGADSGIEQNG